jgi:hypothetical protein
VSEPVLNNIPRLQEQDGALVLLRARQRLYQVAQRVQVSQFLLTVLVPFALSVVGISQVETRPFVALTALVITVLDVVWLDRFLRRRLQVAALVTEQFDCEVLDIPWKQLSTGARADPELISAAARAWQGSIEELRSWYPAVVGRASQEIGRLACQRTNLWYDGTLRRIYAGSIISAAAIATIGLLAWGALANMPLLDLVATVVTPSVPVLIWALREQFRQRDAAQKNETLKGHVERLIEDAATGKLSASQCTMRSRDIQDAIFARRSSNPMILPPIYRINRVKMEQSMNEGTARLLERAGVDVSDYVEGLARPRTGGEISSRA